MIKRTYYIRKRWIAEGEAKHWWVHGEHCYPRSIGFFCPICGEIWCHAPVPGETWTLWHMFCDQHQYGYQVGHQSNGALLQTDVPGSVMLAWDAEWNAALPPAIIARELDLHLLWMVRYANDMGVASAAAALYDSLTATRKETA